MSTNNHPEGTLPEVALADLPEQTKDHLIRLHAATGKPIAEIIREILNRMAGVPKEEGRAA
jgi:hypothetical protein